MPKRRQLRSVRPQADRGPREPDRRRRGGPGRLAGPVVAGAVLVTREFLEDSWAVTRAGRVNDSKLLSAEEREELWAEFESLAASGAIHAHFGSASVGEIERFNILGATKLAMRRALEGIHPPAVFQSQVEPDLFSSLEERAAFRPDGVVPHPDRRAAPAQFSLPARRDRQRRRPIPLHRHGIDRGQGGPGPPDAGARRAGARLWLCPAQGLRHRGAPRRRCCASGARRSTARCSCASFSPARVDPAQAVLFEDV